MIVLHVSIDEALYPQHDWDKYFEDSVFDEVCVQRTEPGKQLSQMWHVAMAYPLIVKGMAHKVVIVDDDDMISPSYLEGLDNLTMHRSDALARGRILTNAMSKYRHDLEWTPRFEKDRDFCTYDALHEFTGVMMHMWVLRRILVKLGMGCGFACATGDQLANRFLHSLDDIRVASECFYFARVWDRPFVSWNRLQKRQTQDSMTEDKQKSIEYLETILKP